MSKKIVLIDDDQDDIEIITDVIRDIDPALVCLSYNYPTEALQSMIREDNAPDFIFTDRNMPGMTGDHCVRELRRHRMFDKTIICVISTSISPQAVQSLTDLGADFIFEKPVSIRDYQQTLTRILLSGKEHKPVVERVEARLA